MSSPYVPADEGDEFHGPSPAVLRLQDVERMDAEHLNGAHSNLDADSDPEEEAHALPEDPAEASPHLADQGEAIEEHSAFAAIDLSPADLEEPAPKPDATITAPAAENPSEPSSQLLDHVEAIQEAPISAEPTVPSAVDTTERSHRLVDRVEAVQDAPGVADPPHSSPGDTTERSPRLTDRVEAVQDAPVVADPLPSSPVDTTERPPRLTDRVDAVHDAPGVADPPPPSPGDTAERSLRLTDRVDAVHDARIFEAHDPLPLTPVGAQHGAHEPAVAAVIAVPPTDADVHAPSAAAVVLADAAAPNGPEPENSVVSAEASHAADALAAPVPTPAARPTAPTNAPLTNAYDAASKLAEDAVAASEAIEDLKRFLQARLSQQSHGSGQMPATGQQAGELILGLARDLARGQGPALQGHVAQSTPPPPAAAMPRVPPPLPMPTVRDTALTAPRRDFMPAVLPPPIHAAKPKGVAVRGFLAGFALSWALGAALYVYLNAG